MKAVLALLMIMIAHTLLYGQSFINQMSSIPHAPDRNEYEEFYIQSYGLSYPFFSILETGGKEQYADYNSGLLQAGIRYDPFIFTSSISYQKLNLYMNYLYAVEDYFKYTSDEISYSTQIDFYYNALHVLFAMTYRDDWGYQIGIGFCILDSEILFILSNDSLVYNFDYSVQNKGGNVEFGFRDIKYSVSYTMADFKSKIYLTSIEPNSNDQNIYPIINGFETGAEISYNTDNYKIEGLYKYSKIDINLYENESQFGFLDNWKYYIYKISARVNITKNLLASGGISGLNTSTGSESYLEIWPFGLWELFLSPRTEFDKLNVSIHLPNVGIRYSFPTMLYAIDIKPSISVDYYYLNISDNIVYREKIWDFYPFVAHYEKHTYDIGIDYSGLFNLQCELEMKFNQIKIKSSIAQLVPIRVPIKNIKNQGISRNKDSGPFLIISVMGYL